MLTLEQFIAKWTGKPVDTDGIYPNQCMDLMHQYLIDCFGLTDSRILAQPQARLVYQNFNNVFGHEMFTQIQNTANNVPIKGDIFFFGSYVGSAGHVCIYMDGDVWTFRSFDANWSTTLPHVQWHNYSGALGWLRFKGVTSLTCDQKLSQIKSWSTDTSIVDSDFRYKVKQI